MDDYPAKQAGLKAGDIITQLNGKPVLWWEDVLGVVHKTTEGSVTLKIKRQEKELMLTMTPKVKEFKNVFGQKVTIGLLGITPSDEIKYVRYNPAQALSMAASKTWQLTWMTYLSLWRMATGAMSLRESVTGPVGIFMVTSKAAYAGLPYLLGIMAILSISLGIFNLLPIPVLDGGHLLFLLIEKIRGRVVSEKVYERVTQVGIAFLVTLMIFVCYSDAVRVGWVDKIAKLIIKQ
jgi:regulator of sigma E protease